MLSIFLEKDDFYYFPDFYYIYITFMIIAIICAIIQTIGFWKILEKGNNSGWYSLIPGYNTYILCKMVGVNPWWILIVVFSIFLCIIPVIGALACMAITVYFEILLNVSLCRAFKKEDGFAVGLILFRPIFLILLGLGSDKYVGPNPMEDILFDNILENKKTETKNNNVNKYCPACGNKTEIDTKYCPKCGKEL